MIYFGDTLTGRQAAEWGLVDEAVPTEEVLDAALTLGRELAARAPIALRAAKQAVDAGLEGPLAAGLRLEDALFASVFSTQDAESGLTSFVTDGPRKAVFRGL